LSSDLGPPALRRKLDGIVVDGGQAARWLAGHAKLAEPTCI